MARDYKDKIEQEGAYVCIPVEALDKVRYYLQAGELTGDFEMALHLIEQELFPEESSTNKQEGGQ